MFMRICDIDGYRSTQNDNIYNTILTGCSLIHKNIIGEYLDKGFKNHESWNIKHHGNCEDLGLNLFIRKYYNEIPQYVDGNITELDNSNGYSSKKDHKEIRGNFCKKYN